MRIAGIGLLCSTCVLLVAIAAGCDNTSQAPPEAPEVTELVVLTPHSAEIRDAFAARFSRWHDDKYREPVSIRWIYRGTVDAQRYIYERFEQYPEARSPQIGVDVFFGGGVPIHRDVAARGYAQPVKVPTEVLKGIPADFNGQPLYSSDGLWHGTALGGFGMLFNRAVAEAHRLPIPQRWEDLASPAYRGWVSAADPGLSGSTAECLVLILLQHGWEQGWGVVAGILANTRGLLPSSGMVAPNVATGIAAAGLQAEFVARMAVADAPDRLEYISPSGPAAMTPDVVTVLTGAQHPDEAAHFVEFVLSDEGQMLWALPRDEGGPATQAPLFSYPIRPEIYEKYADRLAVQMNPFADAQRFKIDSDVETAYTKLLPYLVSAACGRNHIQLQRAWGRALEQGESSPALAALKAPPFPAEQALKFAEECANDPRRAVELEAEWSAMFRQKYEQVLGRPSTQTASR